MKESGRVNRQTQNVAVRFLTPRCANRSTMEKPVATAVVIIAIYRTSEYRKYIALPSS